jgi:hypothetical protein
MVTLESVKTALQIKTNDHDQYLNELITLLTDYVKDYCNNPFETMPAGVELFIPKAIDYLMNKSGVSSETMGQVSYSYDLDFPASILRLLRPYKRLKWS